MPDVHFTIRTYEVPDRANVRTIYGNDEFARPHLVQKHPRMCHHLAGSTSFPSLG